MQASASSNSAHSRLSPRQSTSGTQLVSPANQHPQPHAIPQQQQPPPSQTRHSPFSQGYHPALHPLRPPLFSNSSSAHYASSAQHPTHLHHPAHPPHAGRPSRPAQFVPMVSSAVARTGRVEELAAQYAAAEQERVQFAAAHDAQSQRVLQLYAQATSLARRYSDRVAAAEVQSDAVLPELAEQVKLSQELYSESCRIKDLYARLHAAQAQLLNSLRGQMQHLAHGLSSAPQMHQAPPQQAVHPPNSNLRSSATADKALPPLTNPPQLSPGVHSQTVRVPAPAQ